MEASLGLVRSQKLSGMMHFASRLCLCMKGIMEVLALATYASSRCLLLIEVHWKKKGRYTDRTGSKGGEAADLSFEVGKSRYKHEIRWKASI